MTATTRQILSALADLDRDGLQGLPWTLDLYPQESLEAAASAFADFCDLRYGIEEKGTRLLWLLIREEHRGEARAISGAFLNFLLQHAYRATRQGQGTGNA
jgi:hypothetical protein